MTNVSSKLEVLLSHSIYSNNRIKITTHFIRNFSNLLEEVQCVTVLF